MTRKLTKQEQIRRELRARDLLEQRQLQAAVRAHREQLRNHDKTTRARQRAWRRALAAGRGLAHRAASAKIAQSRAAWVSASKSYHDWWKRVQIERAQRLAKIRAARDELASYRQRRKAIVADALSSLERQLREQREIEHAEEEERRHLIEEALKRAIREARAKAHENRHSSYRPPKRTRKEAGAKRKESRSELLDAIRSNLSPSEFAQWRAYRVPVMAEAKRRGATTAERHVEIFREMVESHPENESRFEQQEADEWVAQEIARHQGESSSTDQVMSWLVRGKPGKPIRLAVLRKSLPDLTHAQIDRALHDLHEAGLIALYRQDNPQAITPADERAALFVGSEPRHLLYVKE